MQSMPGVPGVQSCKAGDYYEQPRSVGRVSSVRSHGAYHRDASHQMGSSGDGLSKGPSLWRGVVAEAIIDI